MNQDELRSRLKTRQEELAVEPPLEIVRKFLRSYCSDAESMDEIRKEVARVAALNLAWIQRTLSALESLLGDHLADGTLAELVAWDANQVLDDPSDAGARAWLKTLAALIDDVVASQQTSASTDLRRPAGPPA